MSAEFCLHFAAACLSYFLRVAAGYFVCLMVARLFEKPSHRSLVWTAFLLGSAAFWLGFLVSNFHIFAAGTTETGKVAALSSTGSRSLTVPLAWSPNIVIAIKALAVVYVVTAVVLIGFAAWKHVRLRVLLSRGIAPSQPLRSLFLEICREMQISRSGLSRTKLVILPGLKSPATAGWWNPRILLPEVCEKIGPTPQVADVLCHELIHVARRDYFWSGLSNFICCLLFFHPAVWRARKAMAVHGELACDLAVVETRPGDRADYADSLTYFVRLRMLQEGFTLGVDFAASTSLGLRIRTILSLPQPIPWWKRFARMFTGLALVASFGIFAPAMTVAMGFVEPIVHQIPISRAKPSRAERARDPHHLPKQVTSGFAARDSLTTLRTRPYVAETPAFTMTSSSGTRTASDRADEQSPAWRESSPSIQYPSISSVVRSTLAEIAARGVHGGHDHDKDDH